MYSSTRLSNTSKDDYALRLARGNTGCGELLMERLSSEQCQLTSMCPLANISQVSGHTLGPGSPLVLQKVASELHPKVRNHGEGPY